MKLKYSSFAVYHAFIAFYCFFVIHLFSAYIVFLILTMGVPILANIPLCNLNQYLFIVINEGSQCDNIVQQFTKMLLKV